MLWIREQVTVWKITMQAKGVGQKWHELIIIHTVRECLCVLPPTYFLGWSHILDILGPSVLIIAHDRFHMFWYRKHVLQKHSGANKCESLGVERHISYRLEDEPLLQIAFNTKIINLLFLSMLYLFLHICNYLHSISSFDLVTGMTSATKPPKMKRKYQLFIEL